MPRTSNLPPISLICKNGHEFITRAKASQWIRCQQCRIKVWVPAGRPTSNEADSTAPGTTTDAPPSPAHWEDALREALAPGCIGAHTTDHTAVIQPGGAWFLDVATVERAEALEARREAERGATKNVVATPADTDALHRGAVRAAARLHETTRALRDRHDYGPGDLAELDWFDREASGAALRGDLRRIERLMQSLGDSGFGIADVRSVPAEIIDAEIIYEDDEQNYSIPIRRPPAIAPGTPLATSGIAPGTQAYARELDRLSPRPRSHRGGLSVPAHAYTRDQIPSADKTPARKPRWAQALTIALKG